jgi:hypothetical protein
MMRTPFYGRGVAFGDLVEWQRQIEDLAGIDSSAPHYIDQLRQEVPHGSRATMTVDGGVEQFLAVQFDPVRNRGN